MGMIDHEKVPAEISRANALLLFSNHENLPCVVCESLCCGLPVLATNVGGLPEIVNDTNGLLCKPQDEAGFLTQIQQLINHYDQYNRSEIAANAADQFNEKLIGSSFVSLYKQVLQHKGPDTAIAKKT